MLVVLGEVYWRNIKISFPIIYKNGIGTFQYFHLSVRERERGEGRRRTADVASE